MVQYTLHTWSVYSRGASDNLSKTRMKFKTLSRAEYFFSSSFEARVHFYFFFFFFNVGEVQQEILGKPTNLAGCERETKADICSNNERLQCLVPNIFSRRLMLGFVSQQLELKR